MNDELERPKSAPPRRRRAETPATPVADGLEAAAEVHELAEAAAEPAVAEAREEAEVLAAAGDERGRRGGPSRGRRSRPRSWRRPPTRSAWRSWRTRSPSAEPAVEAEPEAAVEEAGEPASPPEPDREPTPEPASDDPFGGPGDWYVVHTYAGYENKVKTNLESRIHTMQMEDKIFRVHIPMEDVMEIKGGKKQVVQKKVFPGYLLVKMWYDNDSWYVVRNTPGVTGFVSAGTGSKPTPLSKREIEKILVVKKEEAKPAVRLGFEEGDVVRIIDGPFADFNGTINEINPDQAKLKVLVNIFDRETPVELAFDQVAKV